MTITALARRGVPIDTQPSRTDCFRNIIGGGHLLGYQSHLKQHVVHGPHILNAAGVHANGDYSYIKEYLYVAVRDQVSRDILGRGDLVPCPAMLLSAQARRDAFSEEKSRLRDGHIVLHRDPLVERSMAKQCADILVVDPQPNRRVPWNSGGREMPVTHSPYLMFQEILGAYCVVTRSLHLAIFALAAAVPFCCIDLGDEPQSNKMREYFRRAGIPQVMYSGDNPVHHAVSCGVNWRDVRDREITKVNAHFDTIASRLKAAAPYKYE